MENISAPIDRAYLITREEEFYKIRESDALVKIYVCDYITQKKLANIEALENIYDCDMEFPVSRDQVYEIVNNFYRDDMGLDTTPNEDISLLQALRETNALTISKLIRDYNAFNSLRQRHNLLVFSRSVNLNFKLFLKQYKLGCIVKITEKRLFERNYGGGRLITFDFSHFYYKYRISLVFRLLQKIINLRVFNKKILISDWSTKKYNFIDDVIKTKFSINFLKTAYLHNGRLNSPLKFNKFADLVNANMFIKRYIKYTKNRNLTVLIYHDLKRNYRLNRVNMMKSFFFYRDLFDFYKPREIIFPGLGWEHFTLLSQYAEKKGCTISLLVDGFPFDRYLKLRLLDSKNRNYLVSNIYAQSEYMYREAIKFNPLPVKYTKVKPPILNLYQNLISKKNKIILYDAMIMSYIFNDTDPASRPDLSAKIIIDILNVLKQLNLKNIAIKIKGEREKGYFSDLLSTIDPYFKITYLDGFLYEHIHKPNIIIGGISTAIFESLISNKSYYVYEPYSNGYDDVYLNHTVLPDFIHVARTPDILLNNIKDFHSINNIDVEIKNLFLG